MANKEIGEIDIEICGRSFVLRPSFRGLCEMEDRLGNLMEVAERISKGSVKFRDLIGIVYGGIVGATEPGQPVPISYNDLGTLCTEHGFPRLITPAVLFFGRGLTGHDSEKKTAQTATP